MKIIKKMTRYCDFVEKFPRRIPANLKQQEDIATLWEIFLHNPGRIPVNLKVIKKSTKYRNFIGNFLT